MTFDYQIQNDCNLENGCIKGNNKIVFIQAGLGGNYLGYENKYLKIANHLHEKFGCSVISVSNPFDNKQTLQMDKQIICKYVADNNIEKPEFYFFGHSNGGIKGLELASSCFSFKKMLLVNMPLMINFHKSKAYITSIPHTDILMVYGEKDPSFSYISFLKDKFDNVKFLTVPSADHHFKGMLQEFINLSDLLFDF